MSAGDQAIRAVRVAEANRPAFLANHLGVAEALRFERAVYVIMDRACERYTGGYWEFYQLSNGGLLIAPTGEASYRLCWTDNYADVLLLPEGAGAAVSLMALSHLSCALTSERLAEKFYQLRDFAAAHDEAQKIFAFID